MDQKEKRAANRQALIDYVTGKGFYKVIGIGLAAVVIAAALISTATRGRGVLPGTSAASVPSGVSTASRAAASTVTGLSGQLVINPYSAAQAVTGSVATDEPAELDSASDQQAAQQPEELLFIMPVSGEIMTAYSDTQPMFSPTFGDWRVHAAVDIAGELGTPVRSVANGTVTSIESDRMWGTTVVISHADGYESRYCNLGAKPTVSVGTTVEVGQVIGSIGQTAQAEVNQDPHLHFVLYLDGDPVDPQTVMAALGDE